MSTTLRDVANAAGVSVMSACAVLTGGGRNVKVSEEKAKLIREKAQELRYEPNLAGRSLRTRKTDTIGVVFQHLTTFGEEPYYYQQLLDGIMAALFPRGYTLALSPQLIKGEGTIQVSNGRFDGVLWCCPDLVETSIESAKSLRLPVVMIHAPKEVTAGLPTFAADNERAMERIVNHLVGLGHERIGFVVKPHVARTSEGKARINGFLKAAESLHVKGEVLLWEYAVEELSNYVPDAAPHTALAAYNDVHAGHILSRAKDLAIRVPEDLSVVGFDSSNFCERTQPRLTSVHQPIERMAREATECLLRLIDAGRENLSETRLDTKLYDCQLDIRESTAAPSPHRRGT
ncbi:MAG: LacI family DNA-binding transcriptional regulator [Fimbriimonas sp.]|nr:LacI family DNA-binding transcriptional regulator [Fimbriimonas sp.]